MDLRLLRYFAEVVEAGSLTGAAVKLRMTQPSLSMAMSRLESQLQVSLLRRSPRGVEPTSAGRYLLDASSRLLGDLDDIAATLGRFGSGLEGTLTIAAVPVLMWSRIPRLLEAHASEAPHVDIKLLDPPPWSAIDLLQQGRADIAAIMVADFERFRARYATEFDIVDWGEVQLVAALQAGSDGAGDPMQLTAFDGATIVLPQRTQAVPSLPEAVEAALTSHRVHVREIRVAETIQTGIPLIQAGLAWGILPDPDGKSLDRFDLCVRPLDPPIAPLRALILVPKGRRDDTAISRIIATARAMLASTISS